MLRRPLWNSYLKARALPELFRCIRDHETMSAGQARREIGLMLQEQIRYFGQRHDALPEWKSAAQIGDADEVFQIWKQLPIVTRTDLKERFLATEIRDLFQLPGAVSRTGGSTGEPTAFFHDREMLRATTASRLYCRMRAGWQPGMPTIAVWGSDRDVGHSRSFRNRISGWLRNETVIGGYALTPAIAGQVRSQIHKSKPVALYGFTSMLEYLSREILRTGDPMERGTIAAAWNGGEMLQDRQVELFEQAFGTPLLNLYGSRELSAMAYQTRRNGPLIPVRPFLFLEIINEAGNPVEPGETGRLIWTSTICKGTPFLRYECGDLGSYSSSDKDESGIRALAGLHGRSAGLIHLNGKTIHGLFWNHLFKDYPEVEQFQVVVRGDNRLKLRIKGQPFHGSQAVRFEQVLVKLLGSAQVEMDWVEQIPRSRQGKLEQVVREQ